MERKSALNAAVGAIVLLVVPSSPGVSLLAGGITGYLESTNPKNGAVLGVIAGSVALSLILGSSMVTEAREAFDHGIGHYLWVGLGLPALDGILPFLMLPLLGGAIGSYIRAETSGEK